MAWDALAYILIDWGYSYWVVWIFASTFFFFADNEMVMNCWPVMQSFWKLLYLEREQHWFFLLQRANEATFFEGDVAQ